MPNVNIIVGFEILQNALHFHFNSSLGGKAAIFSYQVYNFGTLFISGTDI